jgi:peptide/nickel transport system permease protein
VSWERFKRRPSARAALWLLASLIAIALCADLIASDLPIVAKVDGKVHVLPCVFRPEALRFDDVQSLKGRAQWMWAPLIPYGPAAQHPGGETLVQAAPSAQHWLGTDDRGRDVAARLVHGTRIAFAIGPLAVGLSLLFGIAVGVACALGRKTDLILGRLVEVGLTFPILLLLLVVQGLRGTTSLTGLAVALALAQWPHIARLVRAEALRAVASPHVEAARAVGAPPLKLALDHVLPLALQPAIVAAAFGVAQAVLFESALSFLGFGVPPPAPSWGELLAQAQSSGLKLWLLIPPALALALLVLACQGVGDGVRAAVEEND